MRKCTFAVVRIAQKCSRRALTSTSNVSKASYLMRVCLTMTDVAFGQSSDVGRDWTEEIGVGFASHWPACRRITHHGAIGGTNVRLLRYTAHRGHPDLPDEWTSYESRGEKHCREPDKTRSEIGFDGPALLLLRCPRLRQCLRFRTGRSPHHQGHAYGARGDQGN